MKLNETIRRLRRAKGLTQEQVAQALGVSGPAVNKWERGACCPDLALLAPLARLLDTDLNTLLSFREELTGAEIAAFTEELYTLAQRLYDTLTGIQWGTQPDPFGGVVKL